MTGLQADGLQFRFIAPFAANNIFFPVISLTIK